MLDDDATCRLTVYIARVNVPASGRPASLRRHDAFSLPGRVVPRRRRRRRRRAGRESGSR